MFYDTPSLIYSPHIYVLYFPDMSVQFTMIQRHYIHSTQVKLTNPLFHKLQEIQTNTPARTSIKNFVAKP